jgi:FlaA1/EpsC-like NDP-sugar epimerase
MNPLAHRWRRHLPRRIYVLILVHLLLFSLSYELALRLRFDMEVPAEERRIFWRTLPWLVAFKLVMFHFVGSLHGWWRYITFADLAALLRVSTLSTLTIACVDYFMISSYQISRSVLLLDWGITILLVGGLRSATRLVREIWWPAISLQGRKPTLLIGAVQGGETLARQIHSNPKLDYRVVGFLDENRSRYGSRLGGIPFLGSPEDAVAVAQEQEAEDLLIISNSLPGERLRELVKRCRDADIRVKMIPRVDELVNGRFQLQVRDVEINDLLQRDPVHLDSQAIHKMLCGKRVMVTGAGGSIGSEICRQIVRSDPASLILIERAENSLFLFEREMVGLGHASLCVPCIADICDLARMRAIFEEHRPEVVFHAAAHKHVPLMESNPSEAIKNNVIGTAELARMTHQYGVERFVMISTDKAVNPTSVMGASKQLAERYVHALSEESDTKFVVVRFGNVLASNGSVVPIFQQQIQRGGPVTVTDPEMRRFFMTIPEASQLVLQAAAMGNGGEIFVLDMGKPVKIVDLAKDLIRLSGLSPDDIQIVFTGMRPGEKLYEELYLDDEETLPTPHPKLRVSYHRPFDIDELNQTLDELRSLGGASDELIRAHLQKLVHNYRPTILRRLDPSAAAEGTRLVETSR